MEKIVFYTCYDEVFSTMARGLVKSVKSFYPRIDFIEFIIPKATHEEEFNLRAFCDFHLAKGRELLKEYDRVISFDTDHIMCNKCPELFGDFDLAMTRNNIPVESAYGWIDTDIYVNAGLTICTNIKAWDEWMDRYYDLCKKDWNPLHEQNALNFLYHYRKNDYKMKLLEFDKYSYGISDNFIYNDMYVLNDELTLTNGKKVCLFHATGTEWKNKENGTYNFDLIKEEKARVLLSSFIA